jgi:hypothetical protein
MSGQPHAPAALTPVKNLGTHWMGGWVGPRAGLDGIFGGKKCVASFGIQISDRPTFKIPKERTPYFVGNYIKIKSSPNFWNANYLIYKF